MKLFSTYALTLLLLISCIFETIAQEFNGFNRSAPYVTAHFRQENLIIEPDATFFNLLIIENRGEQREEITIEINVPTGWSLMAMENRNFIIEPGDSVLVPMRAAPSKMVEGEIGYSVIAAINRRTGETLTNAYCFIKIPRKSDFFFRPLTRVGYFDQQTGKSEIVFRLNNRGNINELVYLSFQSTGNIAIENERENVFNIDLVVPARSDTIVTLPVKLVENYNLLNGSFYRIDMNGYTEDRSFSTSFWFSHLDNHFRYPIPESEKILIAEIALQNLLSEQPTILAGGVRGNILLPQNRDINYILYRYGSGPPGEFLKYSRTRLAYNTPRMTIAVGDVSGLQLKYGGGKGGEFSYRFTDNLRFTAMASENPFRPIRNYGVIIEERYSNINIDTRFAYSENQIFDNHSYLGGARALFRLAPGHSLRTDFALSNVNYRTNNNNLLGYGLNMEYSGRFNQTNIRIREQYGSTSYYGQFAGRHNFTARLYHPLPNDYELDVNVNDQKYIPLLETSTGIQSDRFVDNRMVSFIGRKYLDRGFLVYTGPVYERKATNIFLFYNDINPFVTHSAKATVGSRISDGNGLSFNPSVTFGYSFVTDYSMPDPEVYNFALRGGSKTMFNSHVSVNLRRNHWGTYLNYFYGPYSVNQELSQFYYNIESHSVRIMPYLERYVYKDQVRLSSKFSFLHDFTFKTTRFNFNNQLDIFLRNDYSISLLNTFSHQVTNDLLTEQNYTYSNNYFEVRVRKEFNWNQPRIKYYDLTVNLFKDLNGNLSRDFNEPGVRDIVVSITSIDPAKYSQYGVDYEVPSNMVSTKLLTGMDGTVTYENLARGVYKIELENIGKDQDKYFPDKNEFIVNLTGNHTLYVPYLERNKIFGKIIMNRSRLSNLGRVEISNVKITAVDSKGRETSTLTDGNGYFEMYVPSVDNYVVTVNNIFRDHFNLRQNNFRANLNGFKQFEVNFVFDEIRRQIEFTPGISELETEIRRVGRTNLNGTVRDASTLQPIRANIEVYNNTTGNTVAQTVSDRQTGRYNSTFVTGDEYMLLVSANGYWMHSERLMLEQFLTIQDAERDILLEAITIGARFQLNNLRFSPGSADIPTEAIPELNRLIAQLRQNPNVRIRIEGHSDAVETLDDEELSVKRADTVMRYMVQNGFSNIEFTGLRDSRPAAPNDSEENRRRNRRVEIMVVDR
ncbi:MAG: OmpA family protein [Bacteroidales bacterium]|nr:OmpA family protein [Bacteroidales bacterium]